MIYLKLFEKHEHSAAVFAKKNGQSRSLGLSAHFAGVSDDFGSRTAWLGKLLAP